MENKEQKRIERITGDKFKEMIQSNESLQLGSESRYTNDVLNSSFRQEGKDPHEAVPITIPSHKYRSTAWRSSNLETEPYYEISGEVRLGGSTNESKIYPYDIVIRDCNFSENDSNSHISNVSIQYALSYKSIKFENCIFENHFIISESTISSIEFINCQFNHRFTEFYKSSVDKISISSCTFKELNFNSELPKLFKNIRLKDVTCDILNLNGNHFGDIILNNLNSPSIKFEETYYDLNERKQIPRGSVYINFLDMIIDKNNENSFEIRKVKNSCLRLSGHLKGQSILFRDVETDAFHIENFINEGEFRLHSVEISPNGSGKIIDSQLRKTEFNNVSFEKAKNFQIYFSNLTEIITTNTRFPEHIIARNKDDHQEVREIYRQLKYAASKQGDRIRELKYEQHEFIAHEKSLKGLRQLGNRVILLTNRITNNHG